MRENLIGSVEEGIFYKGLTLTEMDFYFLSNYMEYDRGDSFTFFFEANGILFILKSEGKLSPSPKNI